MDFPAGEIIEDGLALGQIDPLKIMTELVGKKFSGYLVVTIDGYSGLEEGVLLFREGLAIGSVFSYDKLAIEKYGEEALKETLNALKASHGIVDINALTKQQAELVVAFKDKIAVEKGLNELKKDFPKEYSIKFAKETLEKTPKEKTKHTVLEKFGLTSVEK